MIRGILGLIYNHFGIIQVLQTPPIPQTSNWSGTFFAVSYSKPALDFNRLVKENLMELPFFLLNFARFAYSDVPDGIPRAHRILQFTRANQASESRC